MSTQDTNTFRSTDSQPTHCKEDALSEREFEKLYAATFAFDTAYYALESRLILFCAGRLGMRVGEIAHLKEEWIDWRSQLLTIPRQQNCEMGRDGGPCGYCRQAARRMAEYHDLPVEELQATQWRPKTESSAREIPIDVTTRTEMVIEEYFDRFTEFQASSTSINRRVNKVARMADAVSEADTYPHCLRATAASHWAGKGLNAVALKSLMGWSDFSVALKYIEESGERTKQAINAISN